MEPENSETTTSSENKDILIKCPDCLESFIWTEKEQEHLKMLVEEGILKDEQGNIRTVVVPPKRCKHCRARRNKKYQG